MFKNLLGKLFYFVLLVLFFVGGLGLDITSISFLGALYASVLILLIVFVYQKKLLFPNHFFSYLIFLSLFAISLLWSGVFKVSLSYFFLFLGGGLFWLVFYNLPRLKTFNINLVRSIIILGFIYGLTFLYNQSLGFVRINSFSLQSYSTAHLNHHHIGDFWAILFVISLYQILTQKKGKFLWLLFTIPGLYFLAMSLSRSAYLAVVVVVFYLADRAKNIGKKFWPVVFFLFVLFVMFLVVAWEKSLLYSRPYFIQALVGFFRNPLGVGVGNFGVVSSDFVLKDPLNAIFQYKSFSFVTHNILLEFLVGMGLFGLAFIYWFVKVFYQILKDKSEMNLLPRLIFITLTVNFFFDYTYFIPTMLWLWFASLGLAQGVDRAKKISR